MELDKLFLVASNIRLSDWSLEICDDPKIIGRSASGGTLIGSKGLGVSRLHAKVWADAYHWIEDLGSTFGTFVNRVKLNPHQKTCIIVGDTIRLGSVEMQLVSQAEFEYRLQKERTNSSVSEDSDSASSIILIGSPDSADIAATSARLSELTQSEHDIIIWLMRGVVSEAEIAKRTCRSVNTIRTHMNNIHRKLKVHSRHELISLLLRCDPG